MRARTYSRVSTERADDAREELEEACRPLPTRTCTAVPRVELTRNKQLATRHQGRFTEHSPILQE